MSNVKFKPMHEWGHLIKLQEFIDCVKHGGLIDYDGCGDLATETQISNIVISPSTVLMGYEFPEWCTHVMWYNK